MTTYISLLRGINVGGHKIVRMEALRALYEKLDFRNVRSYLQSGNIIFQYSEKDQRSLEKLISDRIMKDFNIKVLVYILRIEHLESIIKGNPFTGDKTKDPAFQHITFLHSSPESYDIDSIASKKTAREEFSVSNDAVYLYCPDGYGRTKLSNNFLESKLQVGATTRNWRSANEILKIATE